MKKNLIGKKFGKLKVIAYHHTDKEHKRCWLCECDCGNTVIVPTGSLSSGNTKGCGCMRGKNLNKNRKYYNDFDTATSIIYNGYKMKAKLRSIDFNLNKEDFIKLIKGSCCYCGIESSHSFNYYKGRFFETPILWNGIDRVDNKKGYSVENCVSCCEICNRSKSDLTTEQFLTWVKRIYITQYHKITDRTPGELVDSLITADIKCFLAQEDMLKENLSDEKRVIAGEKSQRYNAKRNSLISSINKVLDYSDDRIIEKTYENK